MFLKFCSLHESHYPEILLDYYWTCCMPACSWSFVLFNFILAYLSTMEAKCTEMFQTVMSAKWIFFFLFSSLTMAYFYYQNQNVEKVAGKQLYSSLCSLCFDGCILVRIICSVRETAVGRLCCNGQVLHMCFVCRRMFAITTGDWKTEKRWCFQCSVVSVYQVFHICFMNRNTGCSYSLHICNNNSSKVYYI